MHRCVIKPYYLQLIAITAIAAFFASGRDCVAQAHHHGGPGHFSTSTATALPQPVIHDPNFGSPFYNTPFTMGEVLRSHGQLPPITTSQSFNTASCLAISGNSSSPYFNSGTPFVNSGPINRNGWLTYNLGTLGIVSPGWAGYSYYSPYYYGSYGLGYPSLYQGWGYNGFYNPYALYNNGLPFGWVPFWQQPVNRLVPNYGLIFSMAEIVNRGNARFGPTRPVRQLRNANRNPNNNGGIILPGADAAKDLQNQGLNAVAPVAFRPPAQGPADPLKADLADRVEIPQRPPVGSERSGLPPVLRPAAEHAGMVRKKDVKLALAETLSDTAQALKLKDQMQTADRLARNGLFEEARNRYEAIARRQPTAPEPWFRLAQVEVLTGHQLPAIDAWHQFQRLSGRSATIYTKQMSWADIADNSAQNEAAAKLKNWSDQCADESIDAIRATIRPAALVR